MHHNKYELTIIIHCSAAHTCYFRYIETVIQLIHVILKLLEQYCKKEQVHFVRRKKAPKKKKALKPGNE
jgi:hypothetical protein